MKIIAFNCSPRMKNSNTDRILGPLLEGASENGAEIEKIYVRKLKLSPCTGCYTCWLKTPGVCVQDDDRVLVGGKIVEADLIIYGTPVYSFNMTVYMKNLMERVGVPAILPYFVEVDGRLSHPTRYPGLKKKVVLVANGLAWGEGVFRSLVDTFESSLGRAVTKDGSPVMETVGKILVGCGEMLAWDEFREKSESFHNQLRIAGKELVREGRLSHATEEKLGVPLWSYLGMNSKQALEMVNNHFRNILERESRPVPGSD